MKRRAFIKTGALFLPVLAAGQVVVPTRRISMLSAPWADRVVKNGGARPSSLSINASSAFLNTLVQSGLRSRIVAANFFAPDSLIACITPLIVDFGNDPWTNSNFVVGDVGANGLTGNASNKCLTPGLVGTAIFPDDNSAALHLYCFTYPTGNVFPFGCDTSGNGGAIYMQFFSGTCFFNCWDPANNMATGATSSRAGFYSCNKTASNAAAIYFASSAVAFTTLGTGNTAHAHIRNNDGGPTIMATRCASGFSGATLSFAALSYGFSSADSQTLYNAVQALRQALGGGFV